jgi:hypothetical protein
MGKATLLSTKEIRVVEVVEGRPLRPWSKVVEFVQSRPSLLGRVLWAEDPPSRYGALVTVVTRSPARLVL